MKKISTGPVLSKVLATESGTYLKEELNSQIYRPLNNTRFKTVMKTIFLF